MRSPSIFVEERQDAAIVRFDGTIEIHHSDHIRRTATDLITGKGYRNIVFSLAGVHSVASSAFGVFLTLMQSYRGKVRFRFCSLSSAVHAVFAAASLYDFFPVDKNIDASLEVLRLAPAHTSR